MLFPEKAGGDRIHTGKHRAARTGSTCYCFSLLLTTSGAVVSWSSHTTKKGKRDGVFRSQTSITNT